MSALLPQDLLTLPQEFREFRAELREALAAHELRIAAIEERIAAVEERIVSIEEQIARQREEFQRQIGELHRQIDELRLEIQQMRKEFQQQIDELRLEMQQMRKELQQQIDELRLEMQQMRKEFEQRFEEIQMQLAQQRAEYLERFERVESEIKAIKDDMGRLKGDVLEMKWGQRARSYFGRILRKVQVYIPGEICDEIEDRTPIPEPQRTQLLELDYVVRGLRRTDGREIYLAVEVSWGIGVTDVIRARDRAQILRDYGYAAYPVAVGVEATPEARALATAEGVVLMFDSTIQGAEQLQVEH